MLGQREVSIPDGTGGRKRGAPMGEKRPEELTLVAACERQAGRIGAVRRARMQAWARPVLARAGYWLAEGNARGYLRIAIHP